MLCLTNVEVVYSSFILVLRGISLNLGSGKIVAIMGANGAGKSTTLKAISGLLKTELREVTRGTIELNDRQIQNRAPEDIANMGIVQVLEGRRLYAHLTVEENLRVGAHLNKNRTDIKKRLKEVYGYFPRLQNLHSNTSGYLSGGEQQMVVIGRALMARPKVMLLDEPSLGLAPLVVKEIAQIVKQINVNESVAVMLVEQNVAIALSLAEYGYIMENGRVVLDGSSERLSENEDVKEFYLGLSDVGKRKSYREVKHYKRRKRWLG